MRYFNYILLLSIVLMSFSLQGQIEKIVVEKYYVSNDSDATDTTGGVVEAGSTTYRIYVDLMPGNKLLKMYGDVNHALIFSSTAIFYNHLTEGQTFAKEFIKNRYKESTVALDTWLTLGQTTKKQGEVTHFGILKSQDDNGSFIGGANSDGGSDLVSTGLLINDPSSIGLPLTTADGMDTMVTIPDSWSDAGFKDFFTGNDSTMFGSLVPNTFFNSTNCLLENSGVQGVIPDSNQILIAQLTTKGELSFELNFEIEQLIDGVSTIVKYVANDSVLLDDEVFNAYLKYPFECGCNDPNYMEYDPMYACLEEGSCVTPIVLGCMDTMACNYDPSANINVHSLCCYPGWCNDRDISVVCPSLRESSFEFEIYPNPAQNTLFLDGVMTIANEVTYSIFDSFGVTILEENLGMNTGVVYKEINISTLNNGLYLLRVEAGGEFVNKLFMKN